MIVSAKYGNYTHGKQNKQKHKKFWEACQKMFVFSFRSDFLVVERCLVKKTKQNNEKSLQMLHYSVQG